MTRTAESLRGGSDHGPAQERGGFIPKMKRVGLVRRTDTGADYTASTTCQAVQGRGMRAGSWRCPAAVGTAAGYHSTT